MLGQRNSLTPSSVAETTFSGCTVGLKFEINFLNSQKFIKNASEDNGGSNFVPSVSCLGLAYSPFIPFPTPDLSRLFGSDRLSHSLFST